MSETIQLFTKIFLIAMIHIIADIFIDKNKTPLRAKLVTIVCFLGSLYAVGDFVFFNFFDSFGSGFMFFRF